MSSTTTIGSTTLGSPVPSAPPLSSAEGTKQTSGSLHGFFGGLLGRVTKLTEALEGKAKTIQVCVQMAFGVGMFFMDKIKSFTVQVMSVFGGGTTSDGKEASDSISKAVGSEIEKGIKKVQDVSDKLFVEFYARTDAAKKAIQRISEGVKDLDKVVGNEPISSPELKGVFDTVGKFLSGDPEEATVQ